MVLAAGGVVLAHAIGRSAFVRIAGLPIERARFRVFVRIAEAPGRGWSRAGALVAGSAAANLGVVALAFAYFTCHGVPSGERAVFVAEVLPGYDAAGKLAPGDRIVAVDGEPLTAGSGPSLSQLVAAKQGAPVTLTVHREGAPLDVTVQPKLAKVDRAGGAPGWLLGIKLTTRRELDTSVRTAAGVAIWFPLVRVWTIVAGWGAALFGSGDDRDPGGPVRIVDEFRASASVVAWQAALAGATYALLALVLLDAIGLVALGIGRARRRRAA